MSLDHFYFSPAFPDSSRRDRAPFDLISHIATISCSSTKNKRSDSPHSSDIALTPSPLSPSHFRSHYRHYRRSLTHSRTHYRHYHRSLTHSCTHYRHYRHHYCHYRTHYRRHYRHYRHYRRHYRRTSVLTIV